MYLIKCNHDIYLLYGSDVFDFFFLLVIKSTVKSIVCYLTSDNSLTSVRVKRSVFIPEQAIVVVKIRILIQIPFRRRGLLKSSTYLET